MSLRRAAHAVWDCQYHLMWTPKRRKAIFTGEVAARVEAIFRESAEAYDIEILEFCLGVDHLHPCLVRAETTGFSPCEERDATYRRR